MPWRPGGSPLTFDSSRSPVFDLASAPSPIPYEEIDGCRSCGSPSLELVLDLGTLPLSDGLVAVDSDPRLEPRFPLTLVRCSACTLLQIRETIPPEALFGEDYPYYSSFSDELVEHARRNVERIFARKKLGPDSLVVELASNDGYLLQWVQKRGVPVLGIDPAPGPAGIAQAAGIPTICDFFDEAMAERLVSEGRKADVVIGNNVLAHVPDQNAFVGAIERLLAPDGLVVMEFPYAKDLVEEGQFDTIYHEHHCYFSVTSVSALFGRHGLHLVDVEHLPIHGGSLRVFFERQQNPSRAVEEYLQAEMTDVNQSAFYEDFALLVKGIRTDLRALIGRLIADGASVAAYGAAAKGAILLNYCGIGSEQIDYVVDRNHHKHGLLMPGVRIPIGGPDLLRERPPDYLLILAWNFKDEIMSQLTDYSSRGGRFIVPIPEPMVL